MFSREKEKKGELWESQAEAVRITGIPRRTLKEWIDRKKIAQKEYGYVNVIEIFKLDLARKQQEIDRLKGGSEDNPQTRLTLAQCRKIEAEAKIKEFEFQRLEGELLPLSEAIADFETALLSARAKLLAVPSRVALQLSGLSDPKKISALLTEVIDDCLKSLSQEFSLIENPETETEDGSQSD